MRPHIFRCFIAFILVAIHAISSFAASLPPAEVAARAEQGDAEAQYRLGWMYQGGRGVPQSYGEAAKWYRRSAQQGYPLAERYLGLMYQGGYGGLAKDDAEARRWLGEAAKQGDIPAKFALFLDNTTLIPFVRGLPQEVRDVLFFAIIGTVCLIALAVAVLFVFLFWKVLKRFSAR